MKGHIFVFFAVLVGIFGAKKEYNGYSVLELIAKTAETSQKIRELEEDNELDVWHLPKAVGHPAHVVVPPHRLSDVMDSFREMGIEIRVMVGNVQNMIDEEAAKMEARRTAFGRQAHDYDNFNTFEDIMDEMDALAADCPDGFTCAVEDFGISYEGRPIRKLHITRDDEEGRRGYWLDATMHAREWLSTTTVMHLARRLIRTYDEDEDAQYLMDTYDWHICPVMNPDGYVFTHTTDRMWRKSRMPNEGSVCPGTDLNRNWGYKWGQEGASHDPCSNLYCGDHPFDNVETQAYRNEAERHGDNLEAWVSYHTYGDYFLHSHAHYEEGTSSCSEDADPFLFAVADAAVDAIEATHGTTGWQPGTWCIILYPSSGVTIDHIREENGVYYTYTPELRGGSFVVDESQIPLAESEMWNGLIAMVKEIEDLGTPRVK